MMSHSLPIAHVALVPNYAALNAHCTHAPMMLHSCPLMSHSLPIAHVALVPNDAALNPHCTHVPMMLL
ncbi:hypothetical protein DUNSADRAFT_6169 [Dunaliella salina]|uniref:Uncharacterized protein n=1 Tax=Dunaliella salina TaxID=3046 RepID=A0ABQ7GNV1_DUNSA|nr:hypothetical protein DUNSADRAFT_6169 [Dunaliella salina]|eukprot:KAF5836292.1 hypothetical protein DUNSADRAFT_6169 [Dunaliella salina]